MTELMKPIFKLIATALLLLLVVAFSLGVGVWLGAKVRPLPRIRSLAPTVTQLERIGELAATCVHVADVLSAEGRGTAVRG